MPLFEVRAEEIERLDNNRFVDFMNRLLRAEGSAVGILQANIETSVRQYEPDAGIDARVTGASGSEWIPEGLSVWQFKSSDLEPHEIREEFQKPGIQEAVRAGGTYCLVIGESLTPIKQRNRKEELVHLFVAVGIDPHHCRLYTADQVANWAAQHPSFALWFGHPIGELTRWESWANNPRFRQPFYADAQRNQIIEDCRHYIQKGSDIIDLRITGQPGVGKTRLALEVCREEGLRERVIYADCPQAIPSGFWTWLENNPQTHAVLVVDECEYETADRLIQRAQRCNGRVRLLTIGPADRDIRYRPPGVYLLEILPGEIMEKLLLESFPSLPREAVLYVVRVSSGYVKLATVIAEACEKCPEIVTTGDLVRTLEITELLKKIVPDERTRKVMQGLALLSRVGWEEEVSAEGKVLMEFMHLDWGEAQSLIGGLVRKGLVARSGRYRYVTPHLLAVWLAAEVWEDRREDLINLLARLPTWQARHALLARLRDIGDENSARYVCEKLLGPDGLFRTLDDLDGDRAAETFAVLAEAHPQSGLRALERLINGLSRDNLLGFKDGRRHIVWALEKLAWLPETFFGAARVLLALAEAENESYANNATGVWTGLFRVHLGGTAVPFFERLAVLDEALASDSVQRQLLAVKAIGQALETYESRSVHGEEQRGRRVPPEWRPASWEENHKARRTVLERLDRAMASSEVKVREAAERTLLERGRNLVRLGLADELIDRLYKFLVPQDYLRYETLDLIDSVLEFSAECLTPEQKQKFEKLRDQLRGQSFSERLRRWAGRWTWSERHVLYRIARDEVKEDPFFSLAAEAMANPAPLEEELHWLASDEAENVCYFARPLGELDREWRWWDAIELAIRVSKNYALAGCYLWGQVVAGRTARRNQILDSWANDPSMGMALLDAVWRAQVDDGDVWRLIDVVKRGYLQPEKLAILLYGGPLKVFSNVALRALFTLMLESGIPVALTSALQMMEQRLDSFPEESEFWEPLAWEILAKTATFCVGRMDRFHWKRVAQRYVSRNPVKMIELILKFFDSEAGPLIREDEVTDVLEEATKLVPEEAWEKVGDKMLLRDSGSIRLLVYLKGWYASYIDAGTLCAWAEKKRPQGPRLVAEITPVEGVPLPSPARDLLIKFGDEVAAGLEGNFLTGTFCGSEVVWLQGKLELAREWLKDDHPFIRHWAGQIVERLEREIIRAKIREEEEQFYE